MLVQRQTPYQTTSVVASPAVPSPVVTSAAKDIYFCEPKTFASEFILHLTGKRIKNSALYTLEYSDKHYRCPVSGEVENITIYPNTPIFVNDTIVARTLIKELNKGDKLSFFSTPSHDSSRSSSRK